MGERRREVSLHLHWPPRRRPPAPSAPAQLSHHPPVSAYQLLGQGGSWKLSGWSQPAVAPVVKFYGIKARRGWGGGWAARAARGLGKAAAGRGGEPGLGRGGGCPRAEGRKACARSSAAAFDGRALNRLAPARADAGEGAAAL